VPTFRPAPERCAIASIALGALIALSAVAGAAGRVYDSAAEVEPLAVGADVPSVRVTSVKGISVDLSALVRDRGALLVFYRGGW
jgi:hypothetical protein